MIVNAVLVNFQDWFYRLIFARTCIAITLSGCIRYGVRQSLVSQS